jgi:hypothetical protein
MRYREIITETGDTGDIYATRFAAFQRQQAKRTKLRSKLATAQSRAADMQRSAAAKRATAHDRIASIQRDLSKPD